MTGLVFGLLASALFSGSSVSSSHLPLQASEWTFNGAASACTLESEGRATDKFGAELSVQCPQDAQVFGNVVAKLPADAVHQRRITITAEVRVSAGMDASLWLKTTRDNATLLFENDAEQSLSAVTGDDGWAPRSLSVAVAADATSVSYGVLLQGGGAVAVRNLHVTVSEQGATSPAAQVVLNAALAIVRQQTVTRTDIAWRVLETEVRLFASGAQQTADVYPAIKYLLAQLGDNRSLLLTPELAAAFDHHTEPAPHESTTANTASGNKPIRIFTLPDGANLILSATTADLDSRVARNWTTSGQVAAP